MTEQEIKLKLKQYKEASEIVQILEDRIDEIIDLICLEFGASYTGWDWGDLVDDVFPVDIFLNSKTFSPSIYFCDESLELLAFTKDLPVNYLWKTNIAIVNEIQQYKKDWEQNGDSST